MSQEAIILRQLALEITREKKYLYWPNNIQLAAERVVALHAGADALEQIETATQPLSEASGSVPSEAQE